jgi:hypothetical protein
MSFYEYDDERIPSLLLSETRPRARIEHKCSTCPRKILIGQRYRKRFFLVDGEPTTEKVCRFCEDEEYSYG